MSYYQKREDLNTLISLKRVELDRLTADLRNLDDAHDQWASKADELRGMGLSDEAIEAAYNAQFPSEIPSLAAAACPKPASKEASEQNVLDALFMAGFLSSEKLQELEGFTAHELRKTLNKLVADGKVVTEGQRRGKKYKAV